MRMRDPSMTRAIRTRRDVLRLGAATLATLGTAGCLSGGPSDSRTVGMSDDFAFDPDTATVQAGGTVTWENDSDVSHTVTASEDGIPDDATYFASGGFDSERAARNDMDDGLVAPGDDYEHTFEVSGTYDYYCIPHEGSGMAGRVRVE